MLASPMDQTSIWNKINLVKIVNFQQSTLQLQYVP